MITKRALVLGVTAAVTASGSLIAQNLPGTAGYDQYSIDTSGTFATITPTNCPTGAGNCSDIATDDGFLQRQIFDPTSGKTYVQSILTDNKATIGNNNTNNAPSSLKFSTESFVEMGTPGAGNSNTQSGLASKSRVTDQDTVTNNTTMDQTSTVETGNFAVSGGNDVTINQIVNAADANGTNSTEFFTAFNFSKIDTALGQNPQSVELQLASVVTDTGSGEKQGFNFSRGFGDTLTAGGAMGSALSANPLNIGTATIDQTTAPAGGRLDVVWVGQNFGGSAFGLEQAGTATANTGVNTQVPGASALSFTTPGFSGTTPNNAAGFDWNTALGSTPYQPNF